MQAEESRPPGMRELQEADYGSATDYGRGSPHLKHAAVAALLHDLLASTIGDLRGRGLGLEVLEVGAGHGSISAVLLDLGATVTATEMSGGAFTVLGQRYARNPRFRALHDADGSLGVLGGQEFDCLAYLSVLHHIPDYIGAVEASLERLRPGGAFVSFADPAWYPRQSRLARLADRGSYYAWRLGQGGYRRGLSTLTRRLRGTVDEDNPADMVEYHVVRKGVDEEALAALLRLRFEHVRVLKYWSQNAGWAQRLGQVLRLRNAFGIVALGFRGQT